MRCLGAGAASPFPTRREEEGLPGFRVDRQTTDRHLWQQRSVLNLEFPKASTEPDDDRCHSSPVELAPPRDSSMDTVYVVWHAD